MIFWDSFHHWLIFNCAPLPHSTTPLWIVLRIDACTRIPRKSLALSSFQMILWSGLSLSRSTKKKKSLDWHTLKAEKQHTAVDVLYSEMSLHFVKHENFFRTLSLRCMTCSWLVTWDLQNNYFSYMWYSASSRGGWNRSNMEWQVVALYGHSTDFTHGVQFRFRSRQLYLSQMGNSVLQPTQST